MLSSLGRFSRRLSAARPNRDGNSEGDAKGVSDGDADNYIEDTYNSDGDEGGKPAALASRDVAVEADAEGGSAQDVGASGGDVKGGEKGGEERLMGESEGEDPAAAAEAVISAEDAAPVPRRKLRESTRLNTVASMSLMGQVEGAGRGQAGGGVVDGSDPGNIQGLPEPVVSANIARRRSTRVKQAEEAVANKPAAKKPSVAAKKSPASKVPKRKKNEIDEKNPSKKQMYYRYDDEIPGKGWVKSSYHYKNKSKRYSWTSPTQKIQ